MNILNIPSNYLSFAYKLAIPVKKNFHIVTVCNTELYKYYLKRSKVLYLYIKFMRKKENYLELY